MTSRRFAGPNARARRPRQLNYPSYQGAELIRLAASGTGAVHRELASLSPSRALAPFKRRIRAAFVYGSVAKGTDAAKSDIDLMIVGDELEYSALFEGLQEAERVLNRTVNPNITTLAQWNRKKATGSAFVSKVATQPKLFVIGSEGDLA